MKKLLVFVFALLLCLSGEAQTYFYVPVDKDPLKENCVAEVIHFFSPSKISVLIQTSQEIRKNLMANNDAYGSSYFEPDRNRSVYYDMNDSLSSLDGSGRKTLAAEFSNSRNGYNFYINYFKAGFEYGQYKMSILVAVSGDRTSAVFDIDTSSPKYYRLVSEDDFFPRMSY